MPIVSYKSKERIDHQYHLMLALKSKCATCDIFNGISPDKEYLFTIQDYDEPADIAVAVYYECKTYAVYASDDLAENQLSVFELFLRDVKKYAEPGEQIVVFSKRDYDAIITYNYGEPINVKLCV